MIKKKGGKLMEEVERNYSEAANKVEEEKMNLQEIIASVSRSPMKVQSFAYQVLTNVCVLLRSTRAYAFAKHH